MGGAGVHADKVMRTQVRGPFEDGGGGGAGGLADKVMCTQVRGPLAGEDLFPRPHTNPPSSNAAGRGAAGGARPHGGGHGRAGLAQRPCRPTPTSWSSRRAPLDDGGGDSNFVLGGGGGRGYKGGHK